MKAESIDLKKESDVSLLKMLGGATSAAAQTQIRNELTERAKQREIVAGLINKKLAEIETDDRLQQAPALVTINAPLALVQVNLQSFASALRWVLKILEDKR